MDLNFLAKDLHKKIEFYQGSLLDENFVFDLVKKVKADYIVHLASYSSVAQSWQKPVECFRNNVNIFLNLLEAVRNAKSNARILSIGSSEEYGVVDEKQLPLAEKTPLNPISPYAVARVSQEELSQVYVKGYNLQIICSRSFNHIGPRQKDIFVVSSLAKQVMEAKFGKRDKIRCGNLDIIRDFIDVRDVVKAYDLLLNKGKIGGVYNICSGKGNKLSDVLNMLQRQANTSIPIEQDPKLVRPADNPMIIGSPIKIEKELGFRREYELSDSLRDILTYWQNKVSN
jgi:GDP-4-dehydro-6-deoxy-D-mannose reductase